MQCAGHVASNAPYVGVRKYVASERLRRLSGSSLYGIGTSASQVVSSICDGGSDVAGVLGFNSIGEAKTMMFNTYCGPLLIDPR